MESGWRRRLKEMADSDGRSARQISLDAGCGPNYLSEMLKDKDPTVGKLLDILAELGGASLFYVLTGLRLTERDVPFLEAVLRTPSDLRGPILHILNARLEDRSPEALPPSPDLSNEPKSE